MNTKKSVISNNNIFGILAALIVLIVVLSLSSRNFLTAANLLNILQQISINFIIAIGMSYVIILGGIDLSVGSNAALCGLIMAIMMKTYHLPVPISIIAGLFFSLLIGLLNGFLITFFSLPPFIATLGTMSIARGAAYTITKGQPIYTFPESFLAIADRIAGIPIITIIIMFIIYIMAYYVLIYTRYGRYIYAIGGNESCARLSGINVNLVKGSAYVISGLTSGVSAVILTSRLDSAVPTNAEGYEMDAISAVVIGGISMSGGEGRLSGTLIGALIIGVIANGLNLLNVPQGAQRMVKGAIIVLAVIIDVLRRRKKA